MKSHAVSELSVKDKAVLVRGDLDVDDLDNPRFNSVRTLVKWLNGQMASRVKVIGHGGNIGMVQELECDLNWDLRADPREKENSMDFARELAMGFEVYVNESFAVSHRRHTSIDALPRLMKSEGKEVAIGMRFEKEIEELTFITPPYPPAYLKRGAMLLVIGGSKVEDKEKYAKDLENKGWTVLRGGLLPGVKLRPDKLDIADEVRQEYVDAIGKAEVILAAGVMGKYEDPTAEEGTKEVLEAIANSSAKKIAGGGDIEAAISKYNLTNKFDWISVGGGAMLEYITTGTLVGLEAI